MINRSYSKRAQIGATLTWFIAFIIIFFIVAIFIYFSAAVSAKKEVVEFFSNNNELAGVDSLSENSVLVSSLFAVLETRTIVNGTSQRFLDLILRYNDYDRETRLEISEKLEDKLEILCKDYRFSTSDIKIGNIPMELDKSPDFSQEIIVPVHSSFKVTTIKYLHSRSC